MEVVFSRAVMGDLDHDYVMGNEVCACIDAGMECHVLKCEWLDGRPDSGHLQEAARNARFFITFVMVSCFCCFL